MVTAEPAHPPPKALKGFGVADVRMPSTIRHSAYIGKPRALEQMLALAFEELAPSAPLLVIPNGHSVAQRIVSLKKAGLDGAVALHDALGIPAQRTTAAARPGAMARPCNRPWWSSARSSPGHSRRPAGRPRALCPSSSRPTRRARHRLQGRRRGLLVTYSRLESYIHIAAARRARGARGGRSACSRRRRRRSGSTPLGGTRHQGREGRRALPARQLIGGETRH